MTSHLGALNMFPHRLAAALEVALAQRLTENFELRDRLKLLNALGRLRWRSPQLLAPILEPLGEAKTTTFQVFKRSLPLEDLEQLGVEALAGIIYELLGEVREVARSEAL